MAALTPNFITTIGILQIIHIRKFSEKCLSSILTNIFIVFSCHHHHFRPRKYKMDALTDQ